MTDHLILTVDYEVFGHGGGDVRDCVIEPMDAMLRIAERRRVPLTLFVEIVEFDTMERRGDDTLRRQVDAVRQQVRRAVAQGHDVQLHVHPQWEHAEPRGDGTWRVDARRWRIADLDPDGIVEHISRYRTILEDWVRSARPGATVDVFRAGAWCVQPSRRVLAALRAAGIRADSTVAPGLFYASDGDWYDFRTAPPDRCWWAVDDDVCAPGSGDLVEIPIAVAPIQPVRVIANRLRRRVDDDRGDPGHREPLSRGWEAWRGRLSTIPNLVRARLDPSVIDAKSAAAVVRSWRRRSPVGPRPIVGIMHTKTFGRSAARELDRFLEWAGTEPDLTASTYARFMEAAS